MFIDTHTHLFDSQFDKDLAQVITRAKECGVSKFILPAVESSTHSQMLETAKQFENCYPTIGLHPTAMNQNLRWREHLSQVESMLNNPPVKFVAVGEIGLDLYWSKEYKEEQIEGFNAQIELAIKHNLPIIIHCRDAWDEILPIVEQYKGEVRGVFHSFSGTKEQISRIERIGDFFYGINGTVTYKKSTLPEAIQNISLNKILLETDAPYLPPVPHRGERNESSYIPLIAQKIAEIKGVTIEEVAKTTTANAESLFAL